MVLDVIIRFCQPGEYWNPLSAGSCRRHVWLMEELVGICSVHVGKRGAAIGWRSPTGGLTMKVSTYLEAGKPCEGQAPSAGLRCKQTSSTLGTKRLAVLPIHSCAVSASSWMVSTSVPGQSSAHVVPVLQLFPGPPLAGGHARFKPSHVLPWTPQHLPQATTR